MKFEELPAASLLVSLPVVKLGFDTRDLQSEFDKWQRERTQASRKAFDEMLAENAFVEFWGRLGKIGGEGVDGGVKAEDEDGDEGEGGGGKVDMKVLAKNVDVEDMEKVLKVRHPSQAHNKSYSELNIFRMISGITCSIMFLNSESDG